jgi:hypothetical protein
LGPGQHDGGADPIQERNQRSDVLVIFDRITEGRDQLIRVCLERFDRKLGGLEGNSGFRADAELSPGQFESVPVQRRNVLDRR